MYYEKKQKEDFSLDKAVAVVAVGIVTASVVSFPSFHKTYDPVYYSNKQTELFHNTYNGQAEFVTNADYSLAKVGTKDGDTRVILMEHAGLEGGKRLAEELKNDGVTEVYAAVFTNWKNADDVLSIINAENVVLKPGTEELKNDKGENYTVRTHEFFEYQRSLRDRGIHEVSDFVDTWQREFVSLDGIRLNFEGNTTIMTYDQIAYMVAPDYAELSSVAEGDSIDVHHVITADEETAKAMEAQGCVVYRSGDEPVVFETDGVQFSAIDQEVALADFDLN